MVYEELKKLNYLGKGISYIVVNKVLGNEDVFNIVNERDLVVKLGIYEKFKIEVIFFKRGEIYKNLVLILV